MPNKLLYRIAKIIDIGYVSMMYIMLAILMSYLFDRILGKFNKEEEDKKSSVRVIAELLGIFWVYGIIIYIIKNIVQIIPFPLDNMGGYSHDSLKNIQTAGIFTAIFFYFQKNLKNRLENIYNKIHI
jgi:hypothetical protein